MKVGINKCVRWLHVILISLLLVLSAACSKQEPEPVPAKAVVGEVAKITLTDIGLDYSARVDTGARVTSLHAVNIEIDNPSEKHRDNVGKVIRFVSYNDPSQTRQVETTIVDVAKVRNAQGVEYRYVIEMTVVWQGQAKTIHMNLRDRSKLQYKLLMGRNWLQGDYVVDVDQSD